LAARVFFSASFWDADEIEAIGVDNVRCSTHLGDVAPATRDVSSVALECDWVPISGVPDANAKCNIALAVRTD